MDILALYGGPLGAADVEALDLTISQLWPILVGAGTLVSAVAWIFRMMYQLKASIEDKMEKDACVTCRKEVDGSVVNIREEVHALFADLRSEMKEELHKRAKQTDIIDTNARVAATDRMVAVVQTQMATLLESMHRLEDKFDRIMSDDKRRGS